MVRACVRKRGPLYQLSRDRPISGLLAPFDLQQHLPRILAEADSLIEREGHHIRGVDQKMNLGTATAAGILDRPFDQGSAHALAPERGPDLHLGDLGPILGR
jgi:hypothetical protein